MACACVRPLILIASILSLVQGVAWVIMSILGIIIYTEAWVPSLDGNTYNGHLNAIIVIIFLRASSFLPEDVYLHGEAFNIILDIYLALSIIWTLWSVWQIVVTIRGKLKPIYVLIWVVITADIALLDLVVTCLLGHDYEVRVNAYLPETSAINAFSIVATGSLMTLAARGYVLWIINVIFVIILAVLVIKKEINKTQIDGRKNDTAPINAFGSSNAALPWTSEEPAFNPYQRMNSTISQAEWTESQKRNFTRSNSFYNPNERGAPEAHQAHLGNLYNLQSPLATSPPPVLSRNSLKQPGVGPINAFHIPRVPSPDYTPPHSPHDSRPLKSALKTRNQQKANGNKFW